MGQNEIVIKLYDNNQKWRKCTSVGFDPGVMTPVYVNRKENNPNTWGLGHNRTGKNCQQLINNYLKVRRWKSMYAVVRNAGGNWFNASASSFLPLSNYFFDYFVFTIFRFSLADLRNIDLEWATKVWNFPRPVTRTGWHGVNIINRPTAYPGK